jgi:Holliday junction resolvase RusA-like endonuclease
MDDLLLTVWVPGPAIPFARTNSAQLRALEVIQRRRAPIPKKLQPVARYLDYKQVVGIIARNTLQHDPARAALLPWTGPVRLEVVVFVVGAGRRGKRRWDLLNVAKALEDGLNGIVYVDDWQVMTADLRVTEATPGGDGSRVSVYVVRGPPLTRG